MFYSRRPLTALAFAFVFTLAAHAQNSSETPASSTDSKTTTPVAQWRVYASDGRSMQNWHGQAQLQSINFERSKQYRWNGELGMIFSTHVINEPRSWFGDGSQNVPAVGPRTLTAFAGNNHIYGFANAPANPAADTTVCARFGLVGTGCVVVFSHN